MRSGVPSNNRMSLTALRAASCPERSTESLSGSLADLLTQVVEWARRRSDVRAVILVGSHARGDARPDSDVDIGLLVTDQRIYVDNFNWLSAFGTVNSAAIEQYGRVTSVRTRYRDGLEVEFSISPADWASVPVDPGTARVARDGLSVLLDKDGEVSGLASSLPLARSTPQAALQLVVR